MWVEQRVSTYIKTEVFYGYEFDHLDHFISFLNKMIDLRPEPTGKEVLTHFFQSNEALRESINNKENYTNGEIRLTFINLHFSFNTTQLYMTKPNGIDHKYYIKPLDPSHTSDDIYSRIMFEKGNTDLEFTKETPKLPNDTIELIKKIDETILDKFKYYIHLYENNEDNY